MHKSRSDMMSELIIRQSEAIFLEHGYHGTTMDLIAKNCQISKPTLYKYFPSKYELFMHLSLHVEKSIYDFLGGLMEKAEDKSKAIGQVIDYLYQVVEEHGDFFRMMMREHHLIVSSNIDEHIEWYMKSRQDLIHVVSELMKDWIDPELKKIGGVELAAATLYNIMSGLVTDILFQKQVDRNTYKRFFLRLLKHGLVKEV